MNENDLNSVVQDYLDGRMSAAERTAFEERVAADPELRSRIESYREIGQALRDTPADLPPGFHARARDRFETSHAPRPRWQRFLSWEAAGLAAAGLLLVAVMLPDVLRKDAPAPGILMGEVTDGSPPPADRPSPVGKSAALAEPVEAEKKGTRRDTVEQEKQRGKKREFRGPCAR